MVSSYVYDICKDYLDKFLFDFDRSQLSMSILSGNVTLRDVNLRPDELNDFFKLNKIPITIKAGFASRLALTFSVISFHSQPIEIEFSDLCLVIGPSLQNMSNDTSFLQKKSPQRPAASSRTDCFDNAADYDEGDESESSYDSTNGYNVNQHQLKNAQNQQQRQNSSDPFSNVQPHKTWKEHQKFLQQLKMAKIMEQKMAGIDNSKKGFDAFDFDAAGLLEDDQSSETSFRAKLGQIQLKINGLHIRFEEDYFSADKPYSIGLIADQLNLTSCAPGQEIWHFPNFLRSVFDTRSANPSSTADQQRLGNHIFKDLQMQNCRIYVNPTSKIFIPTKLYEEYKHLPMQIFETLTQSYLSELMTVRQGLNFVTDPVDLLANFGDSNKTRFFLNLIGGKIKLNISEPVLRTFIKFTNYIEDMDIIKKLKQYRPQRKPLTAFDLEEKYRGKNRQDLPENIRRKRRLLVRDWFQYAVWYVRLRNVERKKPTAWDRLCKAQLAHDPDRYRDLIRAASDGMESMKDWLSKEDHIKRLEQKERADLKKQFPITQYNQIVISCRIEQLNIQLYEKALQVGIGLPLYNLLANTIAYEKHLEISKQKLTSRLAAGYLILKQVHTILDNDQQYYPARPISSQIGGVTRQSASVLSSLLRNDRKMNRLNTSVNGASPHQKFNIRPSFDRTEVTHENFQQETQAAQASSQSFLSVLTGHKNKQRRSDSTTNHVSQNNDRLISKNLNQQPNSVRGGQIYLQKGGGSQNKLSNVLSKIYGSTISGSAQTLPTNQRNKGTASINEPQIIHQSLQTRNKTRVLPAAQNSQRFAKNPSINQRERSPRSSPIRQEEGLPRGSRFLTMLELTAPNVRVNEQYTQQNGGLSGCCLDILYEVPRFDKLDQLAPLSCMPPSLVSLQRHMKIGYLNASEFYTEQILEGVTKLFANYAWCIAEIGATPSIIEPLFSVEMSDFEDVFNNEMHMHVIRQYLGSRKAEREAQIKKKKLNNRRSIDSQINDGVTSLGKIDVNNQIEQISPRLNMPTMGTKINPMSRTRDHEGEENLTDDAIKEKDYELHQINSASRESPVRQYEGLSQRQIRDVLAARERMSIINDSPLIKAFFEIIPKTPVDFRVIISVHEAKIAAYSSHVPIMKVNLTAPSTIIVNKESQMSSFQVGALQMYFMTEPEMLFALVKSLNAHLQSIYQTSMLRQEQSLLRLRTLIKNHMKVEHKMKRAHIRGGSYNMLFNNLNDDYVSGSKNDQSSQRNFFTQKQMQQPQNKTHQQLLQYNNQQPPTSSSFTQQQFIHLHNMQASPSSEYLDQQKQYQDPKQSLPSAIPTTQQNQQTYNNNLSQQQLQQQFQMLNFKAATNDMNTYSNNNNQSSSHSIIRSPSIPNTASASGNHSPQMPIININSMMINHQHQSQQQNHQVPTAVAAAAAVEQQKSREPINDPAQNKRGVFQQQHLYINRINSTAANQQEQQQENIADHMEQSKEPLVAKNRNDEDCEVRHDGVGDKEDGFLDDSYDEDLDEKSTTQLQSFGGYQVEAKAHRNNLQNKSHNFFGSVSDGLSQLIGSGLQSKKRTDTQGISQEGTSSNIQPPKVSQFINMASMQGIGQVATHSSMLYTENGTYSANSRRHLKNNRSQNFSSGIAQRRQKNEKINNGNQNSNYDPSCIDFERYQNPSLVMQGSNKPQHDSIPNGNSRSITTANINNATSLSNHMVNRGSVQLNRGGQAQQQHLLHQNPRQQYQHQQPHSSSSQGTHKISKLLLQPPH